MHTLKIPCKPGEVSDGYHTFDELYDHRCTLFLALMSAHPDLSWMSTKHHDDSEWEGWFIAGMRLPTGDVTYHLPVSMLGLAQNTGCLVLDRGIEWDGHTAADVVTRVQEWIRVKDSAPDPSERPTPRTEYQNRGGIEELGEPETEPLDQPQPQPEAQPPTPQ